MHTPRRAFFLARENGQFVLNDHREDMWLHGIDLDEHFYVLVVAPGENPAWVEIDWAQALGTEDLREEDFLAFREDGVPPEIACDILDI